MHGAACRNRHTNALAFQIADDGMHSIGVPSRRGALQGRQQALALLELQLSLMGLLLGRRLSLVSRPQLILQLLQRPWDMELVKEWLVQT